MYLNNMQKQIGLLQTLANNELRKMPLPVLWHIRSFLEKEKMTRLDGKMVFNSFIPPFPSPAFDTVIRGIQSLRQGRAIPVSAYVAVTNHCRFRCWHCSKHYRTLGQLSYSCLEQLLRDLQQLGVSIVGFTGGEPLLRDDLEDLVAAVDDRAMTLLFTTGDGLTAKRAAALKRSGLFGMAISLDHFTAAVHDERRGIPGAFEGALKAIRLSREAGLYTMLQLVATEEICQPHVLDRYLHLAKELGVHEIRLMEPMPTGRLMEEGHPTCCITNQQRQLLRDLHVRSNREKDVPKVTSFAQIESPEQYGCGAGFQHLHVDGEGNVCPCDFVPVSFGNIQEEPVQVLWERMNRAFAKPRRNCFLMEAAGQLKTAFNGKLPISYKDLDGVCDFENTGAVPAYYEKLGWS